MLYLVSYDVEGETNYERIDNDIKDKIDKNAQRILNTQWIVNWTKNAESLGNIMLRILGEHASLLVNSLEKENAVSYKLKDDVEYGTPLHYPTPTRIGEVIDKACS